MVYCSKCGAELPDGALICAYCGNKLAKVKYCESCGSVMEFDAAFCPNCGIAQKSHVIDEQTQKYCLHCASIIDKDCVICPVCGKQCGEIVSLTSPQLHQAAVFDDASPLYNSQVVVYKDKWIAIFLCLFFGIFGAHKFYEGKIGAGILYFLSLGLFGMGILVDLILLLTKTNPYPVTRRKL